MALEHGDLSPVRTDAAFAANVLDEIATESKGLTFEQRLAPFKTPVTAGVVDVDLTDSSDGGAWFLDSGPSLQKRRVFPFEELMEMLRGGAGGSRQRQQQPPRPREESYTGTGMMLMEDPLSWGKGPEPFRIVHVVPDSPAMKQGMKQGDLVVKIDGKDIRGKTMDEAVALIRGAEGTNIGVTVMRDGKPVTFNLTRQRLAPWDPPQLSAATTPGNGQLEGMIGEALKRWGVKGQITINGRDINKPAPDTRAYSPCPASPEYTAIIDNAAQLHYNPFALGDVEKLRNKYNCEIKSREDAIKYAQKALDETIKDNYTFFASQGTTGRKAPSDKPGGIGASVGRAPDANDKTKQSSKGPVVVEGVVPGLPAERAGLRKGDLITTVDGKDVNDLPIDDVISLVRGQPGTNVELGILRAGKPQTIKITREITKLADVIDKQLEDGIGYIRLTDFADNHDLAKMADALQKYQNNDSLILDLRYNPGGSLDVVIKMLSMFVPQGDLVSVHSREQSDPNTPVYLTVDYSIADGILVETTRAAGAQPQSRQLNRPAQYMVGGKRVVLLVNELSASASELFAGAIKDNGVATLVGKTTYGKGIGQSTVNIGIGMMSITSLRYASPAGLWPGDAHDEKIGVAPDVQIANPEGAIFGSKEDLQLQEAINLIKTGKAKVAPGGRGGTTKPDTRRTIRV